MHKSVNCMKPKIKFLFQLEAASIKTHIYVPDKSLLKLTNMILKNWHFGCQFQLLSKMMHDNFRTVNTFGERGKRIYDIYRRPLHVCIAISFFLKKRSEKIWQILISFNSEMWLYLCLLCNFLYFFVVSKYFIN